MKLTRNADPGTPDEFVSFAVSDVTADDVGDLGARMVEFIAKWGRLVDLGTADLATLPAIVASRYARPGG